MTSARPANSARILFSGFGIVTIGILVALATDMALNQLTPVKVVFVLGGFALLIPTMVIKYPKAYWLFLLALSIPFDISKWVSAWLVEPQSLVDLYGQPASGTTAIELYVTDVVLVVMVLPWLARSQVIPAGRRCLLCTTRGILSLRRRRLSPTQRQTSRKTARTRLGRIRERIYRKRRLAPRAAHD